MLAVFVPFALTAKQTINFSLHDAITIVASWRWALC